MVVRLPLKYEAELQRFGIRNFAQLKEAIQINPTEKLLTVYNYMIIYIGQMSDKLFTV